MHEPTSSPRLRVNRRRVLAASALLLGVVGAGVVARGGGNPANLPAPSPSPPTSERDLARARVNELGRVPVLEWHEVTETDDRWATSRATFRTQLQTLYDRGYRPVTVGEFADGTFPVPMGTTPFVLTFDDSTWDHMHFGPDRKPHRDSVVGILEAFAAGKPDWRATGAFYIYWPMPFAHVAGRVVEAKEREQIPRKIRWLVDNGYEIGNHSLNHDALNKMDAQGVQRTLALAEVEVQKVVPGYRLRSLALPFGAWPQDRTLAVTGQHEGHRYHHDVVLLVGDMPAYPPHHSSYDPTKVMRVQSYEFGKWIDWLDAEPRRRFFSDGDPSRLTYPRGLAEHASPKRGAKVRTYDAADSPGPARSPAPAGSAAPARASSAPAGSPGPGAERR